MKKTLRIPLVLSALAISTFAASQGLEKQSTASEWLADARCLPQALKVLNYHKMAATNEWTRTPSRRLDGSVTLQSPTRLPGLWVRVTKFLNKEIEIERFTATISAKYKYSVDRKDPARDTCVQTKKVKSGVRTFDKEYMKTAFTDNEVVELIKKGRAGVIYVWSPAMPFSYSSELSDLGGNGIENIRQAAQILKETYLTNVDITFAVDPNPTKELTQAIIAREPHLDSSMGRPAQALELVLRNTNHHYPALLVYNSNGLTRHVFPGVETPEVYARYIRKKLQELNDK